MILVRITLGADHVGCLGFRIMLDRTPPLAEHHTDSGREFPIDNGPKGKAIRKAICDRNGEIMGIMSAGRESFHDFAQALADFGVDNAVYLVGSELTYGFCRDGQGRFIPFSQKHRDSQKYENYIVWRKK